MKLKFVILLAFIGMFYNNLNAIRVDVKQENEGGPIVPFTKFWIESGTPERECVDEFLGHCETWGTDFIIKNRIFCGFFQNKTSSSIEDCKYISDHQIFTFEIGTITRKINLPEDAQQRIDITFFSRPGELKAKLWTDKGAWWYGFNPKTYEQTWGPNKEK